MSQTFSGVFAGRDTSMRLQGALMPGGGLPLPVTITAWISPAGLPLNNLEFGVIAGRTELLVGAETNKIGLAAPGLYILRNGTLLWIAMYMDYTANGTYGYTNYRRAPATLDPTLWDFYAGVWKVGMGGPRVYSGDFATPVAETASYVIRFAESGFPVKAPPAVDVVSGLLVNGTASYLGDWVVGGPQQARPAIAQLGIVPFRGRIAHVTHWADVLTLAQLERLRTAPPSIRVSLPQMEGFPQILGDWWMNEPDSETLILDHSGNARHLGIVNGPVAASEEPLDNFRWIQGADLIPIAERRYVLPGSQAGVLEAPPIGDGSVGLQTFDVKERTTPTYDASLLADGVAIPGSVLDSLTLTYYHEYTEEVTNGRSNQNVLQINDVTVDEAGTLHWRLTEADTVIDDDHLELEPHIARFDFSYPGPHGTASSRHIVRVMIHNIARVS